MSAISFEFHYLSSPERQSLVRCPKDTRHRRLLYGPNLSNNEEPLQEYDKGYCGFYLRMPPGDQTEIYLRSNGPCIRCQKFLRKLVHLTREENSNIAGVFEWQNQKSGFYIHSIGSDRSREFLGRFHQQFLLELLSKYDSTHDRDIEYQTPCSECFPGQEQNCYLDLRMNNIPYQGDRHKIPE